MRGRHRLNQSLEALLSLNISHLHDAANFFALLKNQIDNGAELAEIKRFSRGAAYHFRSLFEELKNKQELIYDSDAKNLHDYYAKEIIDLRDLIELEILQLQHHKRISLKDLSEKTALIEGHFGLLAKVLINIIENALKYSQEPIEIELKELSKAWEIRILSRGNNIPENISQRLGSTSGHGLSASANIMSFHKAELNIYSLREEGSCISLKFKKAKASETKLEESIKKTKCKRINYLGIVALVFCALLIGQLYRQWDIHQASKTKLVKITASQKAAYKPYLIKLSKESLEGRLELKGPILSSYAILLALPHHSPAWQREAKQLNQKLQGAYDLQLALAENYFKEGYYYKAVREGLCALSTYLRAENRELEIARAIVLEAGVEGYLASIHYPLDIDLKKSSGFKEAKPKAVPVPYQANKESIATFDELNQLIEEQSQDLDL